MADAEADGGVMVRAERVMTWAERGDSLLRYRRELAREITIELIRVCLPRVLLDSLFVDPAQFAEDLANAVTERLEARETGEVGGYRLQERAR